MNNLRESIDQMIKNRKRWLQEVEKAKELLEKLPEEIIQLEGEVDSSIREDKVTLQVTVWGKNSEKVLEQNEVQNLQLSLVSKDHISMTGGEEVLPDGTKVTFAAYNLDVPPNCVIESYTEPVTKYRAICKDQAEGAENEM